MRFRTDNIGEVTALIRAHKVSRADAGYAGEIARLCENAGLARHYFSKTHGRSLDDLGEIIWDAGLTDCRPSPDELLQLLESIAFSDFAPGATTDATTDAIGRAYDRARNTRNRLFQCATCGQKVRGTRGTSVLCAECTHASIGTLESELRGMLDARLSAAVMAAVRAALVPVYRVDPLPEEIAASLSCDTSERAA